MVRSQNKFLQATLVLSLATICPAVRAQQQPAVSPSADQGPKISVSVQEVRVDVGVYDKNGHRVEGLKEENFRLYEDDRPVTARSFRYLKATEQNQPESTPETTHLSNGSAYWNHNLPDPSTPLNIIFLDALSEDFGTSLIYPLRQIQSFLKLQLPFAQYAIYTRNTLGSIHLVHGFTSDREELASSLDAKDVIGSSTVTEGTSLSVSYSDKEAGLSTAFSEWLRYQMQNPNRSEPSKDENRERQLAQSNCRSIAASIFEMAEMLAGVPGRKNVLWLNHPVPLYRIQLGGFSCEAETRKALAQLSLAGIVVYPIDIRGLATLPAYDVSKPTPPSLYIRQSRENPMLNPIQEQNRTWLQDLYSSHSLQDLVADETGGDSFQNSNMFAAALERAVSRGTEYYTLTYSPASGVKEDGELHRIKVELVGIEGKYRLKYRHSYRGVSTTVQKSPGIRSTNADQFLFAAQHGAPLENGVSFAVNLEPISPPRLATTAELRELRNFPGAMTDKSGKPKKEVLLQPYRMTYSIRPSETPSGNGYEKQEVSIDTALVAYNQLGRKLMGAKMTVAGRSYLEAKVPGDPLAFHLQQEVVVPVEAGSLRVVVKNKRTGAIGSMEIDLQQDANRQRAALQ